MANVMIIDDDELLCTMVVSYGEKIGHKVDAAHTLATGLARLAEQQCDVVLLDINLPDGNGLQAMREIRKMPGEPVIIIITGEGDPEGAEMAIKNGVWDYIQKPLSVTNLALPLERALIFQEEKRARESLVVLNREKIIGDSPQFNKCLNIVAKAASCEANTLIIGETGTGKEQIAKAIHENSSRKGKNFVVVDCATLPETLVESTLFGHEKGAFTGAEKAHLGLVKMADGGTLFLDEVGEMPLRIQKTFLRVLQERKFRAIGSQKETTSNFRLIAATHRNLDEIVKKDDFREDLLFRLRTITITLPPLRERDGDVKKLAFYFMSELCEKYKMATKGFSPELLEILTSNYSWPGNVRELASTVENLIASAVEAPTLYPEHLPLYIRAKVTKLMVKEKLEPRQPALAVEPEKMATPTSFRQYCDAMIEKIEKQYLEQLIASVNWDVKKAYQIADLSRPRLYALLKKYNINRPKKKS